MGIFWSMVQAPGQREGLRLMKKDLNTPMTTNIAVYDDHLCAESIREVSPDPICLASVDRWYKAPGVRRQMVRDGKIRGVLYIPPGTFYNVLGYKTVGLLFHYNPKNLNPSQIFGLVLKEKTHLINGHRTKQDWLRY